MDSLVTICGGVSGSEAKDGYYVKQKRAQRVEDVITVLLKRSVVPDTGSAGRGTD